MTRPNQPRVLIIGARKGSLGDHIATQLMLHGAETMVAGISTEPMHFDITDYGRCVQMMAELDPTHVVCTAGVNQGAPVYADGWETLARDHMDANLFGPMNLLAAFEDWLEELPGTFVAISSNSAHIPRSNSAAYCASKAALSMALRCAARDLTRAGKPLRVWGYEPGALLGTPMTQQVSRGLGRDVPMSRMLTNPAGMPVQAVARVVARDLLDSADVLHGCMVRLDNGEI